MAMSVTGVEATLKAQKASKDKVAGNIRDGLIKAADIVYNMSQKLVPVDPNTVYHLRDTAAVIVNGTGLATVARVIYDTYYAIYVHENLNNKHAPPTQARFLSDAVHRSRGTITAMMKRQVSAAVKDQKGVNVTGVRFK